MSTQVKLPRQTEPQRGPEGVCTEYRVPYFAHRGRDRLRTYARADIEVCRIALNMDQVRQYNPPPSFAKEADTRFEGYVTQFGTEECWELDALDPTVIANLIRRELDDLIERDEWDAALSKEQTGRDLLATISRNWTKVTKLMEGED